MTIAAAKWLKISDGEKKPFLEMAAKDKERRDSEYKIYEAARPKRPMTPFLIFSNDLRGSVVKENPQMNIADIAKVLGTKWNSLSDKQKQNYIQQSKKLKEKYEVEKAKINKKIASS